MTDPLLPGEELPGEDPAPVNDPDPGDRTEKDKVLAAHSKPHRGEGALDAHALDLMAEQGCGNPGCSHKHEDEEFVLAPGCHPAAGVRASYTNGEGVVFLRCAKCDRTVAVLDLSK